MSTGKEQKENIGEASSRAHSSAVSKDPYIGIRLKGRYAIQRELGRGGIGVVYLANDISLRNRPVVIKVLLDKTNTDEWLVNKFYQEIEALARIDHPGIVNVLDTGEMPDGKPYFVMQFIEGAILRNVMNSNGMNLKRAANIVRQLGHALSAAHDKGIFHRDLKPENIMLQVHEEQEYVKVIDFGISKIKNSEVAESTKVAMMAGTLYYMSPEQINGHQVGAESDIYAFGIIAYEILTGRRPFNFGVVENRYSLICQIMKHQGEGVKVKPTMLRPDLPTFAEECLLRALAYDPKDRYQRAQDFGEELAQALTQPFTQPLTPFTQPLTQPALTHKASLPVEDQPPPASSVAKQADLSEGSTRKKSVIGHSNPILRHQQLVIYTLATIVVILTSLTVVVIIRKSGKGTTPIQPLTVATPAVKTGTPTLQLDRSLVYWLTIRENHDGKPYRTFEMAKGFGLDGGDQVKFNLETNQPGVFYLFSEGPEKKNGLPNYRILHPSNDTTDDMYKLASGKRIQVPEKEEDWFTLDKEKKGVETLWIVWATAPIAEMDEARKYINEKDSGEIKDQAMLTALEKLLTTNQVPDSKIELNKESNRATMRGSGKLIVHKMEMFHY